MSAPTPEPPTGAVAPAASAKAATDAPPIATIHFDFDSDNLRAAARRRLTPIVEFLQTHPDATVRISGYHDARGSRVYNEDLAERRAIAVREALERDGIARGRIIVARPARTIGSGKPEQARRTEVTIVR
jgi:outer membrane protein OmpA-like peptidoglycan-associated protein